MRSIEETRKKWVLLFSDEAIGLDLRQAVKEPEGSNPCSDGLRSICWKAFLLYGPLSQSSWPRKLGESRSAYASLRDHFLRFIEHPDDLQSSVDPLADDSSSPWTSLRQDEINRAEIFQDVERCLQDNFYFREPRTQKMLLDILFIYSKLHPDTGYRQGMHELLAPILWVVEKDAIDQKTLSRSNEEDEGELLMTQALDPVYIEHDTFTLFCAVMQTAKSFYELGDTNDSSPIVARSARIHDEVLASVDPELADHLQTIEILPQIFLIRWIRLLFGREFAFDDVLSVWDLLFAENLNLALIDATCVAMLLRIRWQLLRADYSTALTLLLRYPPPSAPFGPPSLIQDAIYLDREKSTDAGAMLIGRYTGRRPEPTGRQVNQNERIRRPSIKSNLYRYNLSNTSQDSLMRTSKSPARFQQYQKGLENAFQEVSDHLQKRAEGWSISKTVRGAVGEIRRNVHGMQSAGTSPRRSADILREPLTGHDVSQENLEDMGRRVKYLQDRNKALAKMLADALKELRATQTGNVTEPPLLTDNSLNIALAKMQFVQVYLEDPEIPIPPPMPAKEARRQETRGSLNDKPKPEPTSNTSDPLASMKSEEKAEITNKTEAPSEKVRSKRSSDNEGREDPKNPAERLHPRPSLAQSSFSWMLGESGTRSNFISSVSIPREERRESDAKNRPKHLFADGSKDETTKGTDGEGTDDGFTMSSLRGRPTGS